MHTYSRHLLLTGALVVIIMAPAAARGQAALEPIKVTDAQMRAAQLDREAAEYEQTDWGKLRKAAALREEAAELRTADDPKAVVSLYWAARDRYYSDDKVVGRKLMEQSADRAIAIGDVVGAATAYTEAAYIAAELRDVYRTRLFANKAKLLALSPMLTNDQRMQLRTRLAGETLFTGLLAFAERP